MPELLRYLGEVRFSGGVHHDRAAAPAEVDQSFRA
jgi:hypothetical protein